MAQGIRPRSHMPRPYATAQSSTPGYQIRNQDGTADLLIYDAIDDWFGIAAQDVVRDLIALDAETLNVRINSPGGSVFDGIAIMNALKSHPATVNVVVEGLAASIASVIAMAGDTITMAPGSQMMIHDAMGICVGQADDMTTMAALLGKQCANIANLYAARAGGDVADWRAAMAAETWYSDQEAVDAGLADKVAGKAVSADVRASWDLRFFAHAGRENAPKPDIKNLPQPAGVNWEMVSEGGVPCENCQELIDQNPWPENQLPEIPAHPNCDCVLQVAYGVNNATTTVPADPGDEKPVIDMAGFRRAFQEAVA